MDTNDWLLTGIVESKRVAEDGKILSYNILTDRGYHIFRYRRFLRKYVEDYGAANASKILPIAQEPPVTAANSGHMMDHVSQQQSEPGPKWTIRKPVRFYN